MLLRNVKNKKFGELISISLVSAANRSDGPSCCKKILFLFHPDGQQFC